MVGNTAAVQNPWLFDWVNISSSINNSSSDNKNNINNIL